MPGTVAINNFAQRPTIWRFKNSTVKSFGEYGDLTEDEEKSNSSLGSGLTRQESRKVPSIVGRLSPVMVKCSQ